MLLLLMIAQVTFLAGCKASSDSLEEALQQAGENRHQLEAVLSHFQDDCLHPL